MSSSFSERLKSLVEYRNITIDSLGAYLKYNNNWLARVINFVLNSLFYFYRHFIKANVTAAHANAENSKLSQNYESAQDLFVNHFWNIRKLNCFFGDSKIRSLNLVTDSIGRESLFGGVATSLILATLFCKRYNLPLKIITRSQEANPIDYFKLLSFYEIDRPTSISFVHDLKDTSYPYEIGVNDIFLATSWWSAYAIRSTFPNMRFFYLLQEVETFFYPHGDEHLLCKSIEQDSDIFFIVNSRFLFDYFEKNKRLSGKSICFDPAFSKRYRRDFVVCDEKKLKINIFFYARPNNPRNLFYNGIRLLDIAVSQGVINTGKCNIFMAGGTNCPPVVLSNGYRIIDKGVMSLEEYAEFLKKIDLTISLMYTPHPSYPPFDALLAGSVVLTNVFDNKKSFDFTKNAIFTDLNVDSFLTNLNIALDLCTDFNRRKSNFEETKIESNWDVALEKVLVFMGDNCERI